MYRLTARDIEGNNTSVFARYQAGSAVAAEFQAIRALRAWERNGWTFLHATLWNEATDCKVKTLTPGDWREEEQTNGFE
jgi:hypothetical protein